jgi:hypothetical protein
MRHSTSFARRFIAGETVGEAIEAARRFRRAADADARSARRERHQSRRAAAATRQYLAVIDAVIASGIERTSR